MKMKLLLVIFVVAVSAIAILVYSQYKKPQNNLNTIKQDLPETIVQKLIKTHPLQIEQMRKQEYPGSDIEIVQELSSGSNYKRFRVSYMSEGLKIYALLTVPNSQKPTNGWPVIVFNHGYIPPAEYRTTEKYIAYTDAFSRNGYILLRPDYRGHDQSEGNPEGAYYSTAYTNDVLNAVASIKRYPDADVNNIGMWGHSMGGHITLRSMVVSKDIKAGVIWAGVVASYKDMAENWKRTRPWTPSPQEQAIRRPTRQELIDKYGTFEESPEFWESISPISFVKDISGPVQIHHGTADAEVPALFSELLDEALKAADKTTEYYVYPGDDHNISQNLSVALTRSVEFFDEYLKPQ